MMSLEAIESASREAGEKAAREHRVPFALFSADTVEQDIRHATFLGDFVPKGWRPATPAELGLSTDQHGVYAPNGGVWLFVDSSGFGSDRDPALTLAQLTEVVQGAMKFAPKLTLGVAIVQEGQFQVHLGLFVQRELKLVHGKGRQLQ